MGAGILQVTEVGCTDLKSVTCWGAIGRCLAKSQKCLESYVFCSPKERLGRCQSTDLCVHKPHRLLKRRCPYVGSIVFQAMAASGHAHKFVPNLKL